MAKVIILDIETLPKVALVWRFFKENISPKQVLDHGEIASFAYKFLGEEKIYYYSQEDYSEQQLLMELSAILSNIDIVVAHNGRGFDLPSIHARMLVHGIKPPAPYKIVDTLKTARKMFLFESNSLEYLANILECTPKEGHKKFPGFELWLELIKDNPEAWQELKGYNIQDVKTLEEIYLKLRPWMTDHPNVGLLDDKEDSSCPKCGSNKLSSRGYAYLTAGKYARYRCGNCGGWSRGRKNLLNKEQRGGLVSNVI